MKLLSKILSYFFLSNSLLALVISTYGICMDLYAENTDGLIVYFIFFFLSSSIFFSILKDFLKDK